MIFKRVALILLLIYLASLSVYGQRPETSAIKPFLIDEIRSRLTSRSKIAQSDVEGFNNTLISEIEIRQIDFLLKAEDEKEFRRLGASDDLIKAIKDGVPPARAKRLRFYDKLNVPYSKLTAAWSNHKKRSDKEIELAIKAGKKFLKLAGNDPEFEPQVSFVKAVLGRFERRLGKSSQ
jgi:hypothetical protein